jgi:predicted transposase YbfD/YdcC
MKMLKVLEELQDPRAIQKNVSYKFEEIILLVFCAMIANCDTWEDIAEWGEHKIDFLRRYYPYKNGTASHYTLNRIFQMIDTKKFEEAFTIIISDLLPNFSAQGKQIALDGKRLRGAKTKDSILHVVSGYCVDFSMVIAQNSSQIEGKELLQIKEMLDFLDIKGAVITADALSGQKEITKIISDKKGDYILPIKGNQKNLENAIESLFKSNICSNEFMDNEAKNHGRVEQRSCKVINNLDAISEQLKGWHNVNSVVEITRQRSIKDKTSLEQVYYISSLNGSAVDIMTCIRNHWHIENKQHYVLDVGFNEDKNRTKLAACNLGLIRRMALNHIKKYQGTLEKHKAITRIRFKALVNDNELAKIINC